MKHVLGILIYCSYGILLKIMPSHGFYTWSRLCPRSLDGLFGLWLGHVLVRESSPCHAMGIPGFSLLGISDNILPLALFMEPLGGSLPVKGNTDSASGSTPLWVILSHMSTIPRFPLRGSSCSELGATRVLVSAPA